MTKITSIELLSIITKPWVDIKDISLILDCGRDKASEIRNNIINNLNNDGITVPRSKHKIIPTKYLIDYLNLDINYIYNMANLETKLLKGV